jgi:hypothetical protein
MWTNISKPSSSNYTNISKPTGSLVYARGQATGIIGPPTYSQAIIYTNWVNLNKPNSSAWTNIPKPT